MIGWLRWQLGLVLAGLLAAVLLWGAYNIWFFFGENYRQGLSAMIVPAQNWQVVEGQGRVRDSQFRLESPGYRGYALAVAALREKLELEWLDRIVVHFVQLGAYHELAMGVAASADLANRREASLQLSDELTGTLDAVDLYQSNGKIGFLTLQVRGALDPALVVDRVELHREKPGFFELQGLLLASLVDLGDWTQQSINHNRPDYVPLRVSPAVVAVFWVGLFVLLALLLVDGASLLGCRAGMLAGLGVLIGWLLLDVGWQVSLWLRHVDAVSRYSGVPAEEKTINDLDAEVSGFIRDLRDALDVDSQPVVIFSERPFQYFRARYAAVPQPVVGRLGLRQVWLRRFRPRDVLVTIDLRNPLDEQLVSVDGSTGQKGPRDLPLESVAGRHAELVDCPAAQTDCRGSMLRLKEGDRPWLVEVPWLGDLGAGVWQVELGLTGGHDAGWVRLEVFRRSMGNSKRWAWREIYLGEDQERQMSLAFRVDEGAKYRTRLRELNARGVVVQAARLVPRSLGGDLVELSLDGSPPYYLAKRVLKSEGNSAWEML